LARVGGAAGPYRQVAAVNTGLPAQELIYHD
jgi:hypothetical protein